MEHEIVLEHLAAPVRLLRTGNEATVTAILLHEALIHDQEEDTRICVAKLVTIPAEMESPSVLVT